MKPKLIITAVLLLACASAFSQNRPDSISQANRAAVQAAERQSREQSRASRREIDRSQDQIRRSKQQMGSFQVIFQRLI